MAKQGRHSKVAIVGAGFVGSTAAYAMLIRGVAREISLIDVQKEKVEGEAMDLKHGLQFLPTARVSFGQDYAGCEGADVVVITAGANQKPGESRLDLVKKNAAIFKEMVPKIAREAPESVLLVVTNPVDILTYLTLRYSKMPPSQVFGSGTTLDSARLRFLLGEHYKVHPSSVHAYILGEHGDSEFPVWSSANIAGVQLSRYPGYHQKDLDGIYQKTKSAAYEIISRKGATYYAIGIAISEIANAVIQDERSVFPVSTLLRGYHGVRDVCMSVPCVLGHGGIVKQIEIPLDAKEKVALQKSAKTIRAATPNL